MVSTEMPEADFCRAFICHRHAIAVFSGFTKILNG
jgi:hypothetical protein